jgi:hypothetical protein
MSYLKTGMGDAAADARIAGIDCSSGGAAFNTLCIAARLEALSQPVFGPTTGGTTQVAANVQAISEQDRLDALAITAKINAIMAQGLTKAEAIRKLAEREALVRKIKVGALAAGGVAALVFFLRRRKA